MVIPNYQDFGIESTNIDSYIATNPCQVIKTIAYLFKRPKVDQLEEAVEQFLHGQIHLALQVCKPKAYLAHWCGLEAVLLLSISTFLGSSLWVGKLLKKMI